MFGFSGEHLLILGAILLIFGPRKLPELGASMGKAMRNFKEGLNGPTSSGSLEVMDKPAESAVATPVETAQTTQTEKPVNPS